MRTKVLTLFFVLLVPGIVAAAPAPTGTWMTTVNGQRVELRLNADGTGALAGEFGRWQQQGQTLYLVSGEGETLSASYDGKQIVVVYQGVRLVFRRVGGASARPAAKVAPGAGGLRSLPGKVVRIRSANGRVKVPKGWRHRVKGEELILSSRRHKNAGFSITRYPLSTPQLQQSVSALLTQAATAQLGKDAQVRVVMPPRDFMLGGFRASRGIVQGAMGGQMAEGYMGLIVVGRWAYAVTGIYPARNGAALRPVFETLLGSLKATPPKLNVGMMARMAGCWRLASSHNNSSGGVVSSTKYIFSQDGSFNSESFFGGSSTPGYDGQVASFSSKSRERGEWGVFGNTLYIAVDGKPTQDYSIRATRSGIVVDGRRITGC